MATADSCPAGLRHSRSGALGVRSERFGDGVEQRVQLRLPVSRTLHRVGVQPERDVVDEHPPVDLGQVDPPLAAVHERVERADDVVAVDPEVEREMVPGARRYARVRQVELGRDHRDHGLRAVAAGHRERVRALLHRAADELLEVVAAV